MVDTEVLRLRKLRSVALRARALGRCLDSDAADSVFAKGSVLCWTIARIATGRLRSHPYLSYQKGHGEFAALTDAALAVARATAARRQNREREVFADLLQTVAREVDDVRSVSLTPDLSDALGRVQSQMRRLMVELDRKLPVQRTVGATEQPSWPYLAI